jgi:hypothetical protein
VLGSTQLIGAGQFQEDLASIGQANQPTLQSRKQALITAQVLDTIGPGKTPVSEKAF